MLFSEYSDVQQLLVQVLKQVVVADAVFILCWFYESGGRLCTLIGVPCRLSMLSTFSTFANVLF